VGYPGYATALAAPALGGVWLSVCSAGSALAGTLFGGARLRAPIERQFAVATGLMVLPLLLHAAVASPLAFGGVAFVAGAAIAPSIACQSVLVSRLAPPRYATEAFTWSSTCIMAGVGAGLALGGWAIEAHGVKTVFVGGAAVMLGVSLLALALGRLGGLTAASSSVTVKAGKAPADR
jgi:predicted MFS family arabinose efflux permease